MKLSWLGLQRIHRSCRLYMDPCCGSRYRRPCRRIHIRNFHRLRVKPGTVPSVDGSPPALNQLVLYILFSRHAHV